MVISPTGGVIFLNVPPSGSSFLDMAIILVFISSKNGNQSMGVYIDHQVAQIQAMSKINTGFYR